MSGLKQQYLQEYLASNWIAPLGPQVDAFERKFAEAVGAPYALALSSGTAALHLALIPAGVVPVDEVLVSTFTFSASANPMVYLVAKRKPPLVKGGRRDSKGCLTIQIDLLYCYQKEGWAIPLWAPYPSCPLQPTETGISSFITEEITRCKQKNGYRVELPASPFADFAHW